jgi:hypothetical protein
MSGSPHDRHSDCVLCRKRTTATSRRRAEGFLHRKATHEAGPATPVARSAILAQVLDHLALDEAADVDDRDLGMGERRLSMREAGTGAMRA